MHVVACASFDTISVRFEGKEMNFKLLPIYCYCRMQIFFGQKYRLGVWKFRAIVKKQKAPGL